jgi:hypothetical protein
VPAMVNLSGRRIAKYPEAGNQTFAFGSRYVRSSADRLLLCDCRIEPRTVERRDARIGHADAARRPAFTALLSPSTKLPLPLTVLGSPMANVPLPLTVCPVPKAPLLLPFTVLTLLIAALSVPLATLPCRMPNSGCRSPARRSRTQTS